MSPSFPPSTADASASASAKRLNSSMLTETTTTTGSAAEQQQNNAAAVAQEDQLDVSNEEGCSLLGAIFNFTNCIVGAGAIGLGGAMARSGGLVSVLSIVGFAMLTKVSLDLVIELSLETPGAHGSYEDLGRIALGPAGAAAIATNKFLYSFGCLVAYVVVVKDNLGPAVLNLVQDSGHCLKQQQQQQHNVSWQESTFCHVLENNMAMTWLTCLFIMLPLCLLRDMRRLASLSAISIASILVIAGIILYLYWENPNDSIRQHATMTSSTPNQEVYQDWLQIRPGYVECLGTFVFTFVSQHTVHLAFHSLKPHLQTAKQWRFVSFYSVAISCVISLTIAIGVYISFGRHAQSDIFDIYPQIPLIDVAKLLLAVTMVLTFPLPFFTCRELLILYLFPAYPGGGGDGDGEEEESSSLGSQPHQQQQQPPPYEGEIHMDHESAAATDDHVNNISALSDLEQPLLPTTTEDDEGRRRQHQQHGTGPDWASAASSVHMAVASALNYALLPEDTKQLKLPFHVAMTVKLWFVVVGLAIAAPSLGDVLDLVGCATGTIIAFIVPACLSFKLRGYSLQAALLLLVGGVVGIAGTYFSLVKILYDVTGL